MRSVHLRPRVSEAAGRGRHPAAAPGPPVSCEGEAGGVAASCGGGGRGVAPQHPLVVGVGAAAAPLAEEENEKPLELLAINDVDDEVDRAVGGHQKVGDLRQRGYGNGHHLVRGEKSIINYQLRDLPII